MTSEQFCYWLQGFTEITGEKPDEKQWEIIVEHLQTVFLKETKLSNIPYLNIEKFDHTKYPITC